jgi:hypothetical protein
MTKSTLPTTEERKRLRYEEAVKHRPRGACYCDYDDRECYRRGHWNASTFAMKHPDVCYCVECVARRKTS